MLCVGPFFSFHYWWARRPARSAIGTVRKVAKRAGIICTCTMGRVFLHVQRDLSGEDHRGFSVGSVLADEAERQKKTSDDLKSCQALFE